MSRFSMDWSELSQQVMVTFAHFLWQACIVAILLAIGQQAFEIFISRARALRFFETTPDGSRRSAKIRYAMACIAFCSLPICVVTTFAWVHQSRGPILLVSAYPKGSPSYPIASAIEGIPTKANVVIPVLPPPATLTNTEVSATEPIESPTIAVAPKMPPVQRIQAFAPYLLFAYFVGVACMLVRFGLSILGSSRLRRSVQPITDARLLKTIAEQCARVGLKRIPIVALCQRVSVPVVVGIVKPMILLPPALLYGLDPNQIAAILSHEMAHIRRYDLIFNMLQRIVEALLFFHPVTWWISRRVRIERENCCDDVAVDCVGRLPYAGALLQMAELCIGKDRRRSAALATLSANGGNSTDFGHRIRRLIGTEETTRIGFTRRSFSIGLALVSLVTVSLVAWGKNQKSANERSENEAVQKIFAPEPQWQTKLAADDVASETFRMSPVVAAGNRILSIEKDFDLSTGKEIESTFLRLPRKDVLDRTLDPIFRRKSSDRSFLVEVSVRGLGIPRWSSPSCDIRVLRVTDGGQVGVTIHINRPFDGNTCDVDIEKGGDFLLLGMGDEVQVYRTETGQVETTMPIKTKRIDAVAISPDRQWLVVSDQNDLHFWRWREQAPVKTIHAGRKIDSLAFTPDGQYLAEGPDTREDIQLRDLRTLDVIATLKDEVRSPLMVSSMDITQGGQYAAIFDVTLVRPEIPALRLELDTGLVPFNVIDKDPLANGDGDEKGATNSEAAETQKPNRASGADSQAEKGEIKYPYCIVDVEDLKSRPLPDAIQAFNRQAVENPTGVLQLPITEQETRQAIKKFIAESKLTDDVRSQLNEILKSGVLPSNVYFRRYTRFDDKKQMHEVWWVRLVVESTNAKVFSVPVRTMNFKERPYTQMERQQNAGGLTLINRFVSYFAERPNILLLAEFPRDAMDRLITAVEKSIKAHDTNAFLSLFDWNSVSDSTRDFVKSEFDMLTASSIHSIKVTPRNFRGELFHWSAYQHYQPNLEIVGYLDIDFTSDDQQRKLLSLEMGKAGEVLRLVNYVPKGERKFPEGKIVGLSIHGHIEELADGRLLETFIITNPGTLISGHVANEEIRQQNIVEKEVVVNSGKLSGRLIVEGPISPLPRIRIPTPNSPLLSKRATEKARKEYEASLVEIEDESIKVDTEGGLANAFVYLAKAPSNWQPTKSELRPFTLTMQDDRFEPRAAVVGTGQDVRLNNSRVDADSIAFEPIKNVGQNRTVNARTEITLEHPFTSPERFPIQAKSFIHPWKKAFLLPLEHPFAAITDSHGKFSIDGLPPGEHQFLIWHERTGWLEKSLVVNIQADQTTKVNRSYSSDRFHIATNQNRTNNTPTDILWGEPVDGMRLGIRQSEFARRRSPLRHGEHIDCEVWIKNETGELVQIARDPRDLHSPRLMDDQSINVVGSGMWMRFDLPQGELEKAELILPPGQAAHRFLMPNHTASIRPPGSPRGRYGSEPLHLEPGKYPVYAQIGELKSGVEEVEIVPAARLQFRKASQVTEKKREYATSDPSEAILAWQTGDGEKHEAMVNWDHGVMADERDLNSVEVVPVDGEPEQFSILLQLRPESATWLASRIESYSLWDDPNRIAILLDGKPLAAPRLDSSIPDGKVLIDGRFTKKKADEIALKLRSIKNSNWITAPQVCVGKAFSDTAKAAKWKWNEEQRLSLATPEGGEMLASCLPGDAADFVVQVKLKLIEDAECRLTIGNATFAVSKSLEKTQLVTAQKAHTFQNDDNAREWTLLRVQRRDNALSIQVNDQPDIELGKTSDAIPKISLQSTRGTIAVSNFVVTGDVHRTH